MPKAATATAQEIGIERQHAAQAGRDPFAAPELRDRPETYDRGSPPARPGPASRSGPMSR